jgi:predicted enzyme related to lactoylglutathione lyase
MSGRVVHFEVPFEDQQRASDFYAEAFGWQLQPLPEMSYVMVTTGPTTPMGGGPQEPGFVNGGMLARSGEHTAPVVTIEVDDLAAALAEVERLGGSVVAGRTAVGDMGWSGYFRDTEGNVMGLWESAPHS